MMQRRIADHIESRIDSIVETWINAVRADPNLKSDDDLSKGGLVDHVPQMITEICQILRDRQIAQPANLVEGRVHAFTRFRQGFRARDMVRETSLLRLTLLKRLTDDSSDVLADVEIGEILAANISINRYIDEELRYAMAIFTEAREGEDYSARNEK